MHIDIDGLIELANKATPGPWWIDSHGHTMVSHGEGRTDTIFQAMPLVKPAVRHPETGNLSHWPNDWDATFIANANPAVIIALCERLREAESAMKLSLKLLQDGEVDSAIDQIEEALNPEVSDE